MNESDLKQALCSKLRRSLPGCVVLRHEDIRRGGIPDISVSWKGYTTWLEVKYADPKTRSRGQQKTTCTQLSKAGRCWYVIYQILPAEGYSRTLIVKPEQFGEDWNLAPDERVSLGFDHDFVVSFIRKTHGYNNR